MVKPLIKETAEVGTITEEPLKCKKTDDASIPRSLEIPKEKDNQQNTARSKSKFELELEQDVEQSFESASSF